jgi:hypothetical protein
MTAPGDGDPLAAVLVQLGQLADRLGGLDQREAADYESVRSSLADVHVKLTALRGMLRSQGKTLDSLRGLEQAVAKLAEELQARGTCGTGDDEPEYAPIPVVPWWALLRDGLDEDRRRERDEAITRVRAWVTQVYRPLYGHLADRLGDCWESHPLALVTLDWLSELWSVLYLNTDRDARQVGQQAELGTRILPAAAQILGDETKGCQQHGSQVNGYPAPGAVRR